MNGTADTAAEMTGREAGASTPGSEFAGKAALLRAWAHLAPVL
jgi:hypothetical protein